MLDIWTGWSIRIMPVVQHDAILQIQNNGSSRHDFTTKTRIYPGQKSTPYIIKTCPKWQNPTAGTLVGGAVA